MAIDIRLLTKLNDSGIKDAESKFKNFGKKAAVGIGVGVGAAVVLGTKLISAGEDAATANARIGNIADSMGMFTKEITGLDDGVEQVTGRLVDFANATARATGLDQNSIKQAQATLLTFGEIGQSADEAGSEFDRATKAAIDLAAAGFGSVEGNATQLGKALQDPIKGLSSLTKSGVDFTQAEKDMIKAMVESGDSASAQRMILEKIEKQVGGTAEATANGSDRMRVAFSQLMEFVGTKLLPVFEKFVGFMMDKVMPGIQRVIEVFGTDGLAGVFTMFAGVVKEQGPKVLDAIVNFLKSAGDWILNTGIPLYIAYLKFLGDVLVNWVKPRIVPLLKVIGGLFVTAFDWIRNTGLPFLIKKLTLLANAIVDWVKPRIVPFLKKLGEFIAAGGRWVLNVGLPLLAEKLATLAEELVAWIGPKIAPMLTAIGEFLGEALTWLIGTGLPLLAEKMATVGLELVKWILNTVPDVIAKLLEWTVKIGKWIITDGIPAFLGYGLDIGKGLIDGIADAIGKFAGMLLDLGKDIVAKIVEGITSAAGSIGSAVLGAIPGGGVISGAIGGIKNILPFADGGIVSGPTIGLVGEAGPEAIIPLSQLGDVTGRSQGVTVNVQGSVISEGDLVERIRRGLVESQRGGRQLVA